MQPQCFARRQPRTPQAETLAAEPLLCLRRTPWPPVMGIQTLPAVR